MNTFSTRRPFLAVLGALLVSASWASGASIDKAAAERAILQSYRQMEAAYLHKDADGIFRYYAPDWKAVKKGNSSDLAHNRAALIDALGKLRSIKVTFTPEATDMIGDSFFVRYKKSNFMEFPMGTSGNTAEFNQDVWKLTNGMWRLAETQMLDNSVDQALRALEGQKKMMEWQDERRKSQRCIGGVGYGCGGYR